MLSKQQFFNKNVLVVSKQYALTIRIIILYLNFNFYKIYFQKVNIYKYYCKIPYMLKIYTLIILSPSNILYIILFS